MVQLTLDEDRRSPLRAGGVECVLLDFDGPICRLFAGYPASAVASRLKDRLRAESLLPPELAGTDDPHGLLWELANGPHHKAFEVSAEVGELLAKEEVEAATSAEITDDAADLMRALRSRGVRLGVVSNNHDEAIRNFLLVNELLEWVDGPIIGRPRDARLMKPNPYMLLEAVRQLDVKPEHCLFVGDSPLDVLASREAGIDFVGYARNELKKREMTKANARRFVFRMQEVIGLLP
ncbi:HAD family hydrolase [Streptomyces sp. NPDC001070]